MKSQRSYPTENLEGSQEPSVRVCPKYVNTDGYDAESVLRVGGTILDPWQRNAILDWMAIDQYGRWINKSCGGSVPRQNGKSNLVEGRAEAGMLMYNEQVLYTAHLQKTSTETFEEMAAFFDTTKMRKHLKEVKTAIGREQIVLNNGARIKFLARTRNGGRGQHGDLLIFDEAQELDSNQQSSFLPAISASLNPQTIYVGTPPAPGTTGDIFRRLRDAVVEGETSNTAWFEFSVEEIGNVTDKKRWAATNPALGRRIQISTIEGESDQMDPDMFARERLGWWTPIVEHKLDYAIPEDVWEACMSTEPKPEGKTAFGVKFSADGAVVSLCGAVMPNGKPSRVSLIEQRPTGMGLQWLADWLNARYKKASCVVIDGKNGADVLIDKISDTWRMKGAVIRPSTKDVIASAGYLTNSLNEQTTTWYCEQEVLKDSAITSTKRPIAGGWGFGGENSTPIEAAALALWGVATTKRDPSKQMRIG